MLVTECVSWVDLPNQDKRKMTVFHAVKCKRYLSSFKKDWVRTLVGKFSSDPDCLFRYSTVHEKVLFTDTTGTEWIVISGVYSTRRHFLRDLLSPSSSKSVLGEGGYICKALYSGEEFLLHGSVNFQEFIEEYLHYSNRIIPVLSFD